VLFFCDFLLSGVISAQGENRRQPPHRLCCFFDRIKIIVGKVKTRKERVVFDESSIEISIIRQKY
jgi:hypothetical protein